jgi:hypothetical protein
MPAGKSTPLSLVLDPPQGLIGAGAQVRNRRDDEPGRRMTILRRLCGRPVKSTPQRRILKDAQHRGAYIEEAYAKARYAPTFEQEDAFCEVMRCDKYRDQDRGSNALAAGPRIGPENCWGRCRRRNPPEARPLTNRIWRSRLARFWSRQPDRIRSKQQMRRRFVAVHEPCSWDDAPRE